MNKETKQLKTAPEPPEAFPSLLQSAENERRMQRNRQMGYIELSKLYHTDESEEYRAEQEECDRFAGRA